MVVGRMYRYVLYIVGELHMLQDGQSIFHMLPHIPLFLFCKISTHNR